MAVRFAFAALALILAASLCHADIGPVPEHPSVFVNMRKNGSSDLRVTKITYHCYGSGSTDTGSVTQRLADIPCAAGACSSGNSGWFYKFNPCYDFPEGYFSYELNGKEMKTDYFNNTQKYDSYAFIIDSESGKITSINGSAPPGPSPGCLPALALPLLAAAALFASGRDE